MDLYEAFALGPGSIVSIVGATGNTRLAYGLAREAAARGLSVVVTSSAGLPMAPESSIDVVEAATEEVCDRLAGAIRPGRIVIATPRSDRERHWERYPEAVIDEIGKMVRPGLLVVKSDGSRGRPLKAPAAHEPPIPSSATQVIVCVGLAILSEPFTGDHVHRIEDARALATCTEGELVTADVVVEVLTHDQGGRKNVPAGARLSVLLDGPATAEHERLGSYIAGRLVYNGFHRGVVAVTDPWCDVRAVVR